MSGTVIFCLVLDQDLYEDGKKFLEKSAIATQMSIEDPDPQSKCTDSGYGSKNSRIGYWTFLRKWQFVTVSVLGFRLPGFGVLVTHHHRLFGDNSWIWQGKLA